MKKFFYTTFIFFASLVFVFSFVRLDAPIAYAQNTPQTGVSTSIITEVAKNGLVPCGNPGQSKCTIMHIFFLFGRVTNWLIAVAGIFATLQIVRAGFGYAFANGSQEAITAATKGLTQAVVGLVLCLIAYAIVSTILLGLLGIKPGLRMPAGVNIISAPFKYICPKYDEATGKAPTNNGNVECY
ncbi:MAG TPA: pilin [Patescibacteria group bacterium]|nr:pilin [Patescibacteria group bacterium]